MVKKVAILGSTGSIGKSTLEVIAQHPEEFDVVSLAAGTQADEMIRQVKQFKPQVVSMATKEAVERVRCEVGSCTQVSCGEEGLLEVATHSESTHLISALVGFSGLVPTLAAIKAGKIIGIANKETLVIAGHIVRQEIEKRNGCIIPIDSEHSAIFQCLHGQRKEDVTRLILTASGGPFRDWTREELQKATVHHALQHPNWSMGSKITIDTATMMNKGFEAIEAYWLFDMPYDQIDILIHPQSIVHSMVEFHDGSVLAQLGTPDMRVPIQYALSYPKRLSLSTTRLDFKSQSRLDFYEPDFERFPCLKIALEVGRLGGSLPTVLNAANEIAVESFLQGRCSFLYIEKVIERCLETHTFIPDPTLCDIQEINQWARRFAEDMILCLK